VVSAERVQVPDLFQLTLLDAQQVGVTAGVVVLLEGPAPGGVVVRQAPSAGSIVPLNTTVLVWTDDGPGSSGVREPHRPYPPSKHLASRTEPEKE